MDSLCTHADTRSRFRCSEEFAKADYAERSVRPPWHHPALPILYGHLKEELAATCLLACSLALVHLDIASLHNNLWEK